MSYITEPMLRIIIERVRENLQADRDDEPRTMPSFSHNEMEHVIELLADRLEFNEKKVRDRDAVLELLQKAAKRRWWRFW